MKRLILITTLLIGIHTSYAQSVQKMSLEECIEYALQNSASVKKAFIDTEIANAQVGEIKAQGLPQVKGNLQFIDNIQLQTSFLPAVFFAEDPINNPPPADAAPVPVQFGVQYSGNMGVNIDQLLFDGTFFLGLKAAKTYKELAAKNLTYSKVEIAANVMKAYYGVLVNQERFKLIEQNHKRLDSLLFQTKAMYENGFSERLDVDRIQVAFNNIQSERRKLLRLVGLSRDILKFQIGMPVAEKIELAETLENIELNTTQIVKNDFDYSQRIEHSLLETQLVLDEMSVKQFKVGYFPNLYAFSNLGVSSGANKISDLNWFSFGLIGVKANIPIFDGLKKKHQIQQAKLSLQKTEIDLSNLELSIDFEQSNALVNLENAIGDIEAHQQNMLLGKEVYRGAKVKLQEGIGSTLEVMDAETAYKEAETNYYNALYNALIYKVDYEKATGKILNQQ